MGCVLSYSRYRRPHETIWEVGTKVALFFQTQGKLKALVKIDSKNELRAECVYVHVCLCVDVCACVNSCPVYTPPLAQTQASQHLKLIKHKSPQRHRCNSKPILTFRGSFINLFASLLFSSTFLIYPTECCFKMKTFATLLLTKYLNFTDVLYKRST